MSKYVLSGGIVAWLALAAGGCTIETCEQGAVCDKGDEIGDAPERGGESNVGVHDETDQCLSYCDRLSVCGAPQAADFDACVNACKVRFERLPEQTAELCACIPHSRCEDVNEGRCSDDSGAGGTSGSTGSGGSSSAGSQSTGGTSNGGSHASGGSATTGTHASTGGSQSTGGSPGSGGASGGGTPAAAGSACGGTAGEEGEAAGEAGGIGAGGEPSALACTCDCDCPAPQTCDYGYCAG